MYNTMVKWPSLYRMELCTCVQHCAKVTITLSHGAVYKCTTLVKWPSLYRMELCSRVRQCGKVTITLSHGAVYKWWQTTAVRPTQQTHQILVLRCEGWQTAACPCRVALYGPSLSTRIYNALTPQSGFHFTCAKLSVSITSYCHVG